MQSYLLRKLLGTPRDLLWVGGLFTKDRAAWPPQKIFDWCFRNDVGIYRVRQESWAASTQPRVRCLFVKGNAAVLEQPGIALVGTRRASSRGRAAALGFGKALCDHGIHVVSGMARGIDTYAHRGALLTHGSGKTIAVLGSGLDECYPRENRRLAAEIVASGGCVVSEHLPDAKPLPYHFPLRNRIVAGLSTGVFVVEAPEKSGALITTYWALELGKDVFAMAAAHDDPWSRGNHLLIQQGAKLVFQPQDLLALPVG